MKRTDGMFGGDFNVFSRKVGTDFWNQLTDKELMYTGSSPVRTLQYKWEFEKLLEIIGSRNLYSVLEIGADEGGSLWEWLRIMQSNNQGISGHLGVISDNAGRFSSNWFKWAEDKGQNITVWAEDSHAEDLPERVQWAMNPLDMLFIDGDHSYEGAKQDFMKFGPLVKDGGLIVLHDILFTERHKECRVDLLWEEIRQSGYTTTELYSSKTQSGLGIGIVHL